MFSQAADLVMYSSEKYHNPGGNAIDHMRADQLIKETDWDRSENFSMTLEAREACAQICAYILLGIK